MSEQVKSGSALGQESARPLFALRDLAGLPFHARSAT